MRQHVAGLLPFVLPLNSLLINIVADVADFPDYTCHYVCFCCHAPGYPLKNCGYCYFDMFRRGMEYAAQMGLGLFWFMILQRCRDGAAHRDPTWLRLAALNKSTLRHVDFSDNHTIFRGYVPQVRKWLFPCCVVYKMQPISGCSRPWNHQSCWSLFRNHEWYS